MSDRDDTINRPFDENDIPGFVAGATGHQGKEYRTLSIWTPEDTSESGPSIDEEFVNYDVTVNPDGRVVLHLVSDGANGLVTVALTLISREDARTLADAIYNVANHRATP